MITGRENRVYTEIIKPIETGLMLPPYLEVDLMLWDEPYKGIIEYYDKISNLFKNFTDAWFLGGYGPANEPYTIASFLGYESMEIIDIVDDRLYSTINRPDRMKISIEHIYRKLK